MDSATFGWFALATDLTCCSCLILVRIVSFPALTSAFFITGEVAGRFISGFVTVSVGAGFGTGVATAIINGMFRKKAGILITILNFGPRQILLLLVISIGVAAVASFIPVYKIASKRPIEAIRNR